MKGAAYLAAPFTIPCGVFAGEASAACREARPWHLPGRMSVYISSVKAALWWPSMAWTAFGGGDRGCVGGPRRREGRAGPCARESGASAGFPRAIWTRSPCPARAVHRRQALFALRSFRFGSCILVLVLVSGRARPTERQDDPARGETVRQGVATCRWRVSTVPGWKAS